VRTSNPNSSAAVTLRFHARGEEPEGPAVVTLSVSTKCAVVWLIQYAWVLSHDSGSAGMLELVYGGGASVPSRRPGPFIDDVAARSILLMSRFWDAMMKGQTRHRTSLRSMMRAQLSSSQSVSWPEGSAKDALAGALRYVLMPPPTAAQAAWAIANVIVAAGILDEVEYV
jgi:hypothetical protein